MNDLELIRAVCCLAGMGSDVTLEELQVLGKLAHRAGLERKAMDTLLQKAATDEAFRDEQIDAVMTDVDGVMTRLIALASRAGSLEEGHIAMLLWRVATKAEMTAERFEQLLAAAGSKA